MSELVFPQKGGQICLDIEATRTYDCSGSTGTITYKPFADGDKIVVTPSSGDIPEGLNKDVGFSYSINPVEEYRRKLKFEDGCLILDNVNNDAEETEIGEFCLTINLSGDTEDYCITVKQDSLLAMDVVLYRPSDRTQWYVNKEEWSLSVYPKDDYVPLGIVVIPQSHNRYDDDSGSIGVLSLLDASLENPQEGSEKSSVVWGDYTDDGERYTTFRTRDLAVIPSNVDGTVIYEEYKSIVTDNASRFVYMPSDDYIEDVSLYGWLMNDLDPKTAYPTTAMEYGGPSPYLEDDEPSDLYGTKEWNGDSLAFGRFDGEETCMEYLHQIEDTVDGFYEWKHYGQLAPYTTHEALPAMEACWRYAPNGTSEGGWYLPSIGEWGYVKARIALINTTLNQLSDAYGCDVSSVVSDGSVTATARPYFTSTEYMYSDRNYIIGDENQSFKPCSVDGWGVARPFKRFRNVSGYGNMGRNKIPYGFDNDDYTPRWGIYRTFEAKNSDGYPSGALSGTVYACLVEDKNNLTVIATDIPLFDIDGLIWDDGIEEIFDDTRQVGYYNEDVEPGWYVLQRIAIKDSFSSIYNLSTNVSVGDVLSNIDNIWNCTMSVQSKYSDIEAIGTKDGVQYDLIPVNDSLCAFHVGYWNYDTAIFLHSAVFDGAYKTSLPSEGIINPQNGVYVPIYLVNSTWSDSGLAEPDYYSTTRTIVSVSAGILGAGSRIIIEDEIGQLRATDEQSGQAYSALSIDLEYYKNGELQSTEHVAEWTCKAEQPGTTAYEPITAIDYTPTGLDYTLSVTVKVSLTVCMWRGSVNVNNSMGLCSPFVIKWIND